MLTSGVVRRLRVHEVQSRGHIVTLTFAGEDDVTLVVGATVGVDDLGVGRVDDGHGRSLQRSIADLLCIRKRDLLDDGRLVQTSARSRSTSVLDKEDLITSRVPVKVINMEPCMSYRFVDLPCDSLVEDGINLR